MAYVLGFFIADGCLSLAKGRPGNPYTFSITSKDLELLENIKKTLGSEYKISRKLGGSGQTAYQIQVRNLAIAYDVMNLGIFPRKTYNLKPVKVPEEYFADFVRGFFDGDGSVYLYNVNNTPQIKSSFVCTSLAFITDFNMRLCRALNIPEKSIHQTIGKEAGFMTQYSNCFYVDDSVKLAELMYSKNPTLHLERKKEIFEKWKFVKRRIMIKRNYPSKVGWRLSEGHKGL